MIESGEYDANRFINELKQQLDIIIDEVRRDNRGSVVSTIKTSKHGAYEKKKASTKPRKRR